MAGTGNVLSIDANGKVFRGNASTMAVNAVAGNYTATAADEVILVNASSGNITVTLPSTSVVSTGKSYRIKKTDGTANFVTLDGDGAETVDGSATIALNTNQGGWVVVSDGSNWHVVGRF